MCRLPGNGPRPHANRAAQENTSQATEDAHEQQKPPEDRIEDYLTVDPMEVEVGVGLIRLADPKRGGDLLERIQRVRQSVAARSA